MLLNGDCLEKLKEIDDNTIDSVVTDAPYGLAFMGKKWDYDVPSVEIWKEVLRVLKPGGHLLSFGGTRTYHRMVINIEDAGFEIRDQIMWIYGSGFPKSMDISKAIDKQAGAEREIVGKVKISGGIHRGTMNDDGWKGNEQNLTAPATDSAKQWQGWGTALKPANEPICLARKPISEKTVASNVLKHGTGAMNIDESRIQTEDNLGRAVLQTQSWKNTSTAGVGSVTDDWKKGRWPANVIFDEEAGKILDEQISQTMNMHGAGSSVNRMDKTKKHDGVEFLKSNGALRSQNRFGDSGGASRFFYCAKTSKSERGGGNIHPTVKPIKLMSYLIKLVTPPGGIVLDPFMGSGSTGKAAIENGFRFVGIEREESYFNIAEKRISSVTTELNCK